MKKIIYPALMLTLLFSCKEKTENLPSPLKPVSASVTRGVDFIDGRLAFADTTAFLETIHNFSEMSEEELNAWEEVHNFNSLTSILSENKNEVLASADSIYLFDEYFARTLNNDKVVQVGEYIFKVNLVSDRIAVLHKEDLEYIDDLVNEIPNKRIKLFKSQDDVFDLLYSNTSGSYEGGRIASCSGSSAEPRKREADPKVQVFVLNVGTGITTEYYADVKHVYQKAGIYFSLHSESKYMSRNAVSSMNLYNQTSTFMRYEIWFRYKSRCHSAERVAQAPFESRSITDNKLHWRPYESLRALNRYEMRSTYFVNFPNNTRTIVLRDIMSGY